MCSKTKDIIQYITALFLIISGVVLAYISFFLAKDIPTGVLAYIGQAFITGGSIFGVSIYFRDKAGEFKTEAINTITKIVENAVSNKKNSEEA